MTHIPFVSIYNVNSFSVNRTVYSYRLRRYVENNISSGYINSLNKISFFSLFNYEKSYIKFDAEFQKYKSFNFKGIFENVKNKNISFLFKTVKNNYTSFLFKGFYTETKQGYLKFNVSFSKKQLSTTFKRVVFSQEKIKYVRFVSTIGIQTYKPNIEELKQKSFTFRGFYLIKKHNIYSLNHYYLNAVISFGNKDSYQTSLMSYVSKEKFSLNINKFYNLSPVLNVVEFKIEHRLLLFSVYSPTQNLTTAYLLKESNSVYLDIMGHVENKPLTNFYSHQMIFKLNIHNNYTNYDLEDNISFDVSFKNIKITDNSMNFIFVDVYKVAKYRIQNMFLLKQKQPSYYILPSKYNNTFFSVSRKVKIGFSTIKTIKTTIITNKNKLELYSKNKNMFDFDDKSEGVSGSYYIRFYNEYILKINSKTEQRYKNTHITNILVSVKEKYKNIFKIRTGRLFYLKDYKIIFSAKYDSLNTNFTYGVLNFHRYFFSGSNIVNAIAGNMYSGILMDLNRYISVDNYFSITLSVNSYNSDYIFKYSYKKYLTYLESVIFKLCKLETEISLNPVYSVLTGYNDIIKLDLNKITLNMRLNINLHNFSVYYSPEQVIKVRNG